MLPASNRRASVAVPAERLVHRRAAHVHRDSRQLSAEVLPLPLPAASCSCADVGNVPAPAHERRATSADHVRPPHQAAPVQPASTNADGSGVVVERGAQRPAVLSQAARSRRNGASCGAGSSASQRRWTSHGAPTIASFLTRTPLVSLSRFRPVGVSPTSPTQARSAHSISPTRSPNDCSG